MHSEIFFRERNDGQIARWKLGGSRQADLPFLLEDLTPIDTRVPLTGATGHANGAKDLIGVPGIEIAIDLTEITYWHFICDQHQVVFVRQGG